MHTGKSKMAMNSLALRGTVNISVNRGENRVETVNDLRLPPAAPPANFPDDS